MDQFNYQLSGPENGRRWVFLHGLMGFGLNWRKIVQNLEATERVLTYDQRGHGKSIKPANGYSPEDFADDLYKIAQDLGWDRFILVGHSMGGRNALIFANKYPQMVERLVIEDIGPDSNPDAPRYFENMLGKIPTPFPSKQAAKDFFMNQFLTISRSLGQPDTLGGYLYANLIETPDGKADWRFRKEAIVLTARQGRASDHWKELRRLNMPTLIIRGERSEELPRAIYDRMLLANPNIQGIEISNAGHWVHSDQPQEFLKALKDFCGL